MEGWMTVEKWQGEVKEVQWDGEKVSLVIGIHTMWRGTQYTQCGEVHHVEVTIIAIFIHFFLQISLFNFAYLP